MDENCRKGHEQHAKNEVDEGVDQEGLRLRHGLTIRKSLSKGVIDRTIHHTVVVWQCRKPTSAPDDSEAHKTLGQAFPVPTQRVARHSNSR